MSIQDVEKFYIRIEDDPQLQKLVKNIDKEKEGKIKSFKDVIDLIKKKIVPLGAKFGYKFSTQELLLYETKILRLHYKYVSEEDLRNTNGGISENSPKSISRFIKNFNLDNGLHDK